MSSILNTMKYFFVIALLLLFAAASMYSIYYKIIENRISRLDPHEVVKGGAYSLIERGFLKGGLDPNKVGAAGETPLYDAIRRGDPMTVRVLLSAGARLDVINDLGLSPYQFARQSGASEPVISELMTPASHRSAKGEK